MAKPKIMSDIGNTENLVTEQKELVSAINSVVEAVNGKIDKTQIKNSLTETVGGNALDATQGKVLDDKINILNKDRGYLNSKDFITGNANDIKTSGKYFVRAEVINMPIIGMQWHLEVTCFVSGWCVQTAYLDNWTSPKTYQRTSVNNSWSDWQQIVTINDINNRGYLNTRVLSVGEDLDTITENGIYTSHSMKNAPTTTAGEWFNIFVTKTIDNYATQVAFSANNPSKAYIRTMTGGTDAWHSWHEIATTTKTPFSCSVLPGSGITITSQDCYTLNGEFYISICLAKTDGTNFIAGATPLCSMPYTTRSVVVGSTMCNLSNIGNSYWSTTVPCFIAKSSSNIVMDTSLTTVNKVFITMKGDIA